MGEFAAAIQNLWENYIWYPISNFSVGDALDILVLTAVLYGLFLFFQERRAGKLAVGLVIVMAIYVIGDLAGLRTVHQLMDWIAPFFIVLVAVIFQPEIRDGLERLGDKPFGFLIHNRDHADTAKVISEVVEAACQIAQTNKDGALIVIERSTPLGDFVNRGHKLDAEVSAGLLRNIFVDGTPLHDGAVIIRNNRIAAACCELPLTSNEEVVRGVGSRHRAAVGITEVSDCVVVVVSEQRHVISIANNGYLKKNYNQKADEFLNEASAKSIQKALRKDLARLLRGDTKIFGATDEDGDEVERKSILPEIRFTWGFGAKTEKADKQKPAVNREIGNHLPKGKKNRYHITQVSKGTASEEFDVRPAADPSATDETSRTDTDSER
ncbi:MAG: TIGR00159 family protein [Ruminococcaceae bacterium]|nr:TIGR00159 family protein [Oscillospiraceae bacterium]